MISQNRYVNIISGVGAGAAVGQRNLIMRVITQNTLLPPGVVAEFSNSTSVGNYFGTNSEEYKRAVAYFGFISKQINSPQIISFSRWVNASIAAQVVGDSTVKSLIAIQAVTAGTLTILSNGTPVHVTALNFAAAADLTACAAILQTAIRATADTQLTTANVTYNTNTNQFVLTGDTVGSGTLSVALGGNPPLATDVAGLIGWGTTGTINVPGQTADTAVAAITKSAGVSNNFGSFIFATPTVPMAVADITAIASWNDSQNNVYLYSTTVTAANAASISAAVIGFSGCNLNLLSTTQPNDFVEQSPCEILAATNYTQTNATQNFMFYQFPNRNITVSDDTTANQMDALRVNYIGVTQINGVQVAFYQRGLNCGNSQVAAVDTNVYCNEMWLKSALAGAIISFLLAVGRVPADEIGEGEVLGVLQPVIDQAKQNGTMSAGKALTAQQQQFITQISGSALAWRQVQTIGFWINVTFSSYVNSNTQLTEWKASYLLIYSKDDAIRFVDGRDIMI